jgi:hypothetical protein
VIFAPAGLEFLLDPDQKPKRKIIFNKIEETPFSVNSSLDRQSHSLLTILQKP